MGIYALPLYDSVQPIASQSVLPNPRLRKRKRSASPFTTLDEPDDESYNIAAGASNPLSLTPDEVRQYRLAGWPLHRALPDTEHFPHAPVPTKNREAERSRREQREDEGLGPVNDEAAGAPTRDHFRTLAGEPDDLHVSHNRGLRLQHVSVLVTLLHRCLADNDIRRATQAFTLLSRTRVAGRHVDLRGSDYWGVAAELLMRSHDVGTGDAPFVEPAEDAQADEPSIIDTHGAGRGSRHPRWGTSAGLEKLKNFYERLIIQYPHGHVMARNGRPTSLDFWPLLITCEIYGIQADYDEAVRDIERGQDVPTTRRHVEAFGGHGDGSLPDADLMSEHREDTDSLFTSKWQRKDAARRTALEAAERLAARMDTTMALPPYSDSHTMLRLRGMMALYIGDLSVPEISPTTADPSAVQHQASLWADEALRRLDQRERIFEHQNGLQRRNQEHLRAREIFDKIRQTGGKLDDVAMADVSVRGSSLDRGSASPSPLHEHAMAEDDQTYPVRYRCVEGEEHYDHYDVS